MIYAQEGLPGFLRGLLPSVLKNTLNAGTYYSILFYTETYLKLAPGKRTDSQNQFLASSFARAVQAIICNPLVVIKTRLEVIGFNEYDGIVSGARTIVAQEGFRGFFTGLGISLIRDVPFSGIFYPVYKGCRHFYT